MPDYCEGDTVYLPDSPGTPYRVTEVLYGEQIMYKVTQYSQNPQSRTAREKDLSRRKPIFDVGDEVVWEVNGRFIDVPWVVVDIQRDDSDCIAYYVEDTHGQRSVDPIPEESLKPAPTEVACTQSAPSWA